MKHTQTQYKEIAVSFSVPVGGTYNYHCTFNILFSKEKEEQKETKAAKCEWHRAPRSRVIIAVRLCRQSARHWGDI